MKAVKAYYQLIIKLKEAAQPALTGAEIEAIEKDPETRIDKYFDVLVNKRTSRAVKTLLENSELKELISELVEALENVKCELCQGTGRNFWHRKDYGECTGCNGSGQPKFITKALSKARVLGRAG